MILAALPGIGAAQEIVSVTSEGTCRDFTVTLLVSGLSSSSGECWDVKLDVPGKVEVDELDGDWQSTFYYVEDAICTPAYSAVLRLDLSSREDIVRGTAMLRQGSGGSKVVEKDFTIVQSCPPAARPLPDDLFILLSFGVVLVFGWGIAWWWRRRGHIEAAAAAGKLKMAASAKGKAAAGKLRGRKE